MNPHPLHPCKYESHRGLKFHRQVELLDYCVNRTTEIPPSGGIVGTVAICTTGIPPTGGIVGLLWQSVLQKFHGQVEFQDYINWVLLVLDVDSTVRWNFKYYGKIIHKLTIRITVRF